jgi:DNA-binding PadR family transcriptional regulator
MAGLERITKPTLDVVEQLLLAHQEGVVLHGWAIMKATHRAGPTVYRVLDRLEDSGMIQGEWEELGPNDSGPRRRFYMLTGHGVPAARALLAQRRPAALNPRPAHGFSALRRVHMLLAGGGR